MVEVCGQLVFYIRPRSVPGCCWSERSLHNEIRLSILWSSVIAFCMKSVGSVDSSLSCRPTTLLGNLNHNHDLHSISLLRCRTLAVTASSLLTSHKRGRYSSVQKSVCYMCLFVSLCFVAAEFLCVCLCGIADARAVCCFKNNILSRIENSGYEMCSGTSGCITYGQCCPRAATMNPLKGSNAIAVRAVGYSRHFCSIAV